MYKAFCQVAATVRQYFDKGTPPPPGGDGRPQPGGQGGDGQGQPSPPGVELPPVRTVDDDDDIFQDASDDPAVLDGEAPQQPPPPEQPPPVRPGPQQPQPNEQPLPLPPGGQGPEGQGAPVLGGEAGAIAAVNQAVTQGGRVLQLPPGGHGPQQLLQPPQEGPGPHQPPPNGQPLPPPPGGQVPGQQQPAEGVAAVNQALLLPAVTPAAAIGSAHRTRAVRRRIVPTEMKKDKELTAWLSLQSLGSVLDQLAQKGFSAQVARARQVGFFQDLKLLSQLSQQSQDNNASGSGGSGASGSDSGAGGSSGGRKRKLTTEEEREKNSMHTEGTDGADGKKRRCTFPECKIESSSPSNAVRHYQEQHKGLDKIRVPKPCGRTVVSKKTQGCEIVVCESVTASKKTRSDHLKLVHRLWACPEYPDCEFVNDFADVAGSDLHRKTAHGKKKRVVHNDRKKKLP
jgi:hypothetical protein